MNKEIILKRLNKNGLKNTKSETVEIDIDGLEVILVFINNHFRMINSINTKHSSYGLKHIVERCLGSYVSNGELIAAMILCGYKYKRYRYNGINCHFNVGNVNEKRIKKLIENSNI